jgi:hypothetical protein
VSNSPVDFRVQTDGWIEFNRLFTVVRPSLKKRQTIEEGVTFWEGYKGVAWGDEGLELETEQKRRADI